MAEGQNHLESEIAQLQQAIEEKRRILESEHGVTREDKDLVRDVVSSHIYNKTPTMTPAASTPAATSSAKPKTVSYLDTLDEEQVEKLNTLINAVSEKGIKKVIEEAKQADPFILDAFHDALVDKLYDELKSRGVVK